MGQISALRKILKGESDIANEAEGFSHTWGLSLCSMRGDSTYTRHKYTCPVLAVAGRLL
jgi:hypothetical protein